MKKPVLIIVFVIFLGSFCYSQFREGYVINNANETINGYINFEGSISNSDQCKFRLHPEGETKVFKPGEIKAFGFKDGKLYSSREISINNEQKSVFLELLIKGRVSLLNYIPAISETRYFLLTKDDSLVELINSTQNITKDGTAYKIKKQEYKNTLSLYLKDCPTLKPKIDASLFNSRSFIKLISEYHSRTSDSLDYTIYGANDRKTKYSFGISGSIIKSDFTLNTGMAEVVMPSNKLSYGFTVKAENLPALSPKFSAKLNLMFSSSLYRYDTTVIYSAYPAHKSAMLAGEDRLFEVKKIRMPLQITYRFIQKRVNPFLALGATFDFRYSYKKYNQWLIDYCLNNQGYTLGSKMKVFQLGLNSGAGIEFEVKPNFSINAGYDFEYFFKFFGGINDYTKLMNHHVYISTYYSF